MEDNTFNKLADQVQSQLSELHDNIDQYNKDVFSVGQDIIDLQDQIQNLLKQVQNNIQSSSKSITKVLTNQSYKEQNKLSNSIKKKSINFLKFVNYWNKNYNKNERHQQIILKINGMILNQNIQMNYKKKDQKIFKNIDHEAQMLNKLVGELALEAHKADQILDLVDTNQQTTKQNLVKPKTLKKSANKKWLIIGLLAIILVGVLVTILVLKLK